MLVFVDESGDAGMKFDSGSSKLFVVTAVLFEDHDEANACDRRISELRAELRFPERTEFHFCKTRPAVRCEFLKAILPFQFFYLAVVLNKPKLTGPGFQFKDSLVKYTSRLVFENAKPYLDNAIVTVDGSGKKEFRSQLSEYLKRHANPKDGPKRINKVKICRSDGNNLVQMADMVCGAIWRCCARDDPAYRQMIAARELRVQVWP